jgi:TatD DNase family protein
LAPVPFRSERNEPAFVVKVSEVLGESCGTTSEEIGALTTKNFERLFRPQTADNSRKTG